MVCLFAEFLFSSLDAAIQQPTLDPSDVDSRNSFGLLPAHEESLIAAAGNGDLWNSTVIIVLSRATMAAYIASALSAQPKGVSLRS